MTAAETLPSTADVEDAARRLADVAVATPLLESPLLNRLAGRRILVKAEVLQRTGSFKFRGAYNRITRLDATDRARGVVAYSSGNHAQGVACAARMSETQATIVMPDDAPALKRANTASYGARVVTYRRDTESREAIGERIAAESGATLVRPFDDRFVIAGQGTVGLEIAATCAARGVRPDAVVAPVGGGGLIAGVGLGLDAGACPVPLYGAEPEGYDDTRHSLESGARVSAPADRESLCDALLADRPGAMTFALNRARLHGVGVVSDADVMRAMAAAFLHLKIVVEPGGAAALAAVLRDRSTVPGDVVVAVASGGNVDPGRFVEALTFATA
jgi:threonine dehydratase